MNTRDRILGEFEAIGRRLAQSTGDAAEQFAAFATARAEHLTLQIGDPNFDAAAEAEAAALVQEAARLGILVGDQADAARREVLLTAIRFAAAALT